MTIPVLKPRALKGENGMMRPHVRIVAPASNARADRVVAGAAALEARGYTVSFGEHARGRQAPYFSATPEARLGDLHAAFADPAVDIVMCTRGGYGSNYLMERLDLGLIASHPKPFLAYSDLTVVQTWLMDQTGLVAFHGPMLAADFFLTDGVDDASFAASLKGEALTYSGSHGLRMLRPGRAEGVLYGGCLTLLTASLGTPFAPRTEGKLLFLEDVGVKPYQVDRMLRQLRLAGKLEGVTGIVFGEMLGCVSPGVEDPALAQARLEESILGALDWGEAGGFPGPVALGLRSGHVSRANVTLPLNLEADLIMEGEPVLRMREPAVVL
jgi:muramoyltetrapeptide carboxypeptidase